MRTTADRFLDKVSIPSPSINSCWLWTGAIGKGGYGNLRADKRYLNAHKWAYEHWVGPVPDGLHLDHLCRVRNCVNPAHLEAVTRAENLRRGRRGTNGKEKLTHCPHGHPYSGDNLRIARSGQRVCRECSRKWSAANNERRRVKIVADQ